MKLLYGTTNPGKLESMRKILSKLNIQIIGINEMHINEPEIDESGKNPLENAKIKALTYYKMAKMPVFSCDSGLYIQGLDVERQPGTYVRRVNGKSLTDEEMIEYYSGIAKEMGGEVIANYKNSICIVVDENNIFEYDGEGLEEKFIITSKPNSKRTKGFPLDSISLDINTKKYFIDMESNDFSENNFSDGIKKFFKCVIDKTYGNTR